MESLRQLTAHSQQFLQSSQAEIPGLVLNFVKGQFNLLIDMARLSIENNSSPLVQFLIFLTITRLMGPSSPPESLNSSIQMIMCISNKVVQPETQAIVSSALAPATFHLLNPNTVQVILDMDRALFASNPPLSLHFRAEYAQVISNALDVDLMRGSVFLSVVQILPVFVRHSLEIFAQFPQKEITKLLDIFVTFLQEPQLREIVAKSGNNVDMVPAFRNEMSAMIFQVFGHVPEMWAQGLNHDFLLDLFDTTKILFRPTNENDFGMAYTGVFNAFITMPVEPPVVQKALAILKEVCDVQFTDGMMAFLCNVAGNATDAQLIDDSISCMSFISDRLPNETAPQQFVELAPALLGRILENEEYDGDISCLAYLIRPNPGPTFGVINQLFSSGALTVHKCIIVLQLINSILEFATDDDRWNPDFLNAIAQFLAQVLSSPFVQAQFPHSEEIACQMITAFRLIPINEAVVAAAQSVFQSAPLTYGLNERVMAELIKMTARYHFSTSLLLQSSATIEPETLTKIAARAPPEETVSIIQGLLSVNMPAASALLIGLMKKNPELDLTQFLNAFMSAGRFVEAVEITIARPDIFEQVVSQIPENIEEEAANMVQTAAIRVARKHRHPEILEVAFRTFLLSQEYYLSTIEKAAELLEIYESEQILITDNALEIVVRLFLNFAQHGQYIAEISPRLFNVIRGNIGRLMPALSPEFWAIAFDYFLNHGNQGDGNIFYGLWKIVPDAFVAIEGQILGPIFPPPMLQQFLGFPQVVDMSEALFNNALPDDWEMENPERVAVNMLDEIMRTYRYLRRFQP